MCYTDGCDRHPMLGKGCGLSVPLSGPSMGVVSVARSVSCHKEALSMGRDVWEPHLSARLPHRLLVTFLACVLVSVTCTSPPSPTGTTVSLAGDSQWQVPPGFELLLPFTFEQVALMLRNDPGSPPDIPEFTMSGGREKMLIAVYSDWVLHEPQAMEELAYWLESVTGAAFDEPSIDHQGSLSFATTRGVAQSLGQAAPQGFILTAVVESDTGRAWRLACAVASEEISDEAAQICEETRSSFHPLPDSS